jgi:hypothetical protein
MADVGLEVFTAVNLKITLYRDVTPCGVVDICRRFRGMKCLHLQDK